MVFVSVQRPVARRGSHHKPPHRQHRDGHNHRDMWVAVAASLEILMRFYGPTKAFIDKMWQLPDIELTEQ